MLHRHLAVHLAKECPWRRLSGISVIGGFTLFDIRLRFLRNLVQNSNSYLKATIHCLASLCDQQMHSLIEFVWSISVRQMVLLHLLFVDMERMNLIDDFIWKLLNDCHNLSPESLYPRWYHHTGKIERATFVQAFAKHLHWRLRSKERLMAMRSLFQNTGWTLRCVYSKFACLYVQMTLQTGWPSSVCFYQ